MGKTYKCFGEKKRFDSQERKGGKSFYGEEKKKRQQKRNKDRLVEDNYL